MRLIRFRSSKPDVMFTKSNSNGAGGGPKSPAKPTAPSIVSRDLRIQGDLESEGDVQVDGRVDGDLRVRTVTVGENALVNGAVFGDSITIAGQVNGEIRGKSVKLLATAKVVGDIHHDSLAIEAGAFLQGLCRRISEIPGEGVDEDKPPSAKKDKAGTKSLN